MNFDPRLPDEGTNVSPTHPLREAALLVFGVVGAVALFALVTAVAVDLLVPHISPRLEARLFSAFAPDGEAATDPRTRPLQELLDRLLRHWPESPQPLYARIWEQEEVNAFALPGGSIVLTTGLLERVGSENELAFVLGHEIGHFRGRDHLRGLGRGVALGMVLAAARASGAGAAGDLAGLAGQLTSRGFDRDQERAADAFGLSLLAAEYGHVGGAADFFSRALDPDAVHGEALAGYLSTHPLHQDRLEALRREAERRGWPSRGPLLPLPD